MHNNFEIKIKALTPIWTGDAERKNSRLRETGIIGSLRWWYEAVVRGLGGYACDPTDTKCEGENHCVSCELFGCTGWARKFRIEIADNNIQTIPNVWIGTRRKYGRNNRYLKRNVTGLMSNDIINIRIIPLHEIKKNEWVLLNRTIELIEENGAIGAHTSQGNGVIKIVDNNLPYNNEYLLESLKKNNNNANYPSIDDFFFHKYQLKFNKNISQLIKDHMFWTHNKYHNGFHENWNNWNKLWNDYSFLPISFHIRDAIRQTIQDKNLRHDTFGEGGHYAKGSKVFVSHGYKLNDSSVRVRIWGYGVEKNIKNKIKDGIRSGLEKRLFSKEIYKGNLTNCNLTEEKVGTEILEEIK